MAGPERDFIEVQVLGARAERTVFSFAPGVAVPPFSVGTNAQWSVFAEGVGPVHFFLGYSGHTVHVAAAASDLPVLLSGSAVGMSWSSAPVPCEIRFGNACLVLRSAAQSGALGAFEARTSTLPDQGAPLQAAQRAMHAAKASALAGAPASPGSKRLWETILVTQPTALPMPPAPPSQWPGIPDGIADTQPLRARSPEGFLDRRRRGPNRPRTASYDDEDLLRNRWHFASAVEKTVFMFLRITLGLSCLMLAGHGMPKPTTGNAPVVASTSHRAIPDPPAALSPPAAPVDAVAVSLAEAGATIATHAKAKRAH